MPTTATRRLIAAFAALLSLAACAGQPLEERPEPLGDFRLGYAVVKAEDPARGPLSREADPEALKAEIEEAVRARLGRYDGDGLYHLGIAVGGYVLARPGVPVIYQPKSVLILDVTLFDNATQTKINEEPHRITAFEGLENTVPIVGSGMVRTGDEQLENLATQAAVQIENWLRANPEWFEPEPGQERVAFDQTTGTAPSN